MMELSWISTLTGLFEWFTVVHYNVVHEVRVLYPRVNWTFRVPSLPSAGSRFAVQSFLMLVS